MPNMDGSGPMGTGPLGRGLGPCGSGQAGWDRGRGFRRGGGRWDWAPFSADQESAFLEQRKSWLKRQLEAISQRQQTLKEKEG